MITQTYIRLTRGPAGDIAENRVTLPAAPWDAPQTAKPAPPRPCDEPARQSVYAKPVLPPKPPRFDAMGDRAAGLTMAEAVAIERRSLRFQRQYAPQQHASAEFRIAKAKALDDRIVDCTAHPATAAEIAVLCSVGESTARSAINRMIKQGRMKSTTHRPLSYYRVKSKQGGQT